MGRDGSVEAQNLVRIGTHGVDSERSPSRDIRRGTEVNGMALCDPGVNWVRNQDTDNLPKFPDDVVTTRIQPNIKR